MSFVSYKADLHTHSILSQDGGITEKDYAKVLLEKKLDVIAITDHNTIAYAKQCQEKLGEAIIIGEEITTKDGEIIGLFLRQRIPPFLSLQETIILIKQQRGIVYIPHPFDTQRNGIGEKNLKAIQQKIDIIETFNGRMVYAGKNAQAACFAEKNNLLGMCSSDAHSAKGLGYAYAIVEKKISKTTCIQALSNASYNKSYLPLSAYFAPTYNKIKHYVFS